MARPAREQQAWDEIGDTEIGRPVAVVLAGLTLLSLLGVASFQLAWPNPRQTESPFARLGWGTLAAVASFDGSLAFNRDLLAEMHAFESALENASWLQRAAQPLIQQVLTVWGGVGNESVYIGRDGWLFYRPDVDLVTGRGFLEPRVLERRRRAGESWRDPPQPDPLPALLDFYRRLAARGIALVVLPVPTKATLVPRALAAGAPDPVRAKLRNPSYDELVRRLRGAGVEVFDPTEVLLETSRALGREPSLRTDTHWTPAAMDGVARALAARLEQPDLRLGPRCRELERRDLEITRMGDVRRLLDIDVEPGWLRPDTVTISRVGDSEGRPVRAEAEAELLLLGDSYLNVYSDPRLGWGDSAGLAEQLSFHLGRPVDWIAINDGADQAVRRQLASGLRSGGDRLAGKRVVIYELIAHELATGDWQVIELPAAKAVPPPERKALLARARVAAIARLPAPGTTPYRDALLAVHLTEVEALDGEGVASEVLAYAWGLRDGRPAGAARWRNGERLELRLVPWSQVPSELESLQRIELPGDELFLLDTYWVETDDEKTN